MNVIFLWWIESNGLIHRRLKRKDRQSEREEKGKGRRQRGRRLTTTLHLSVPVLSRSSRSKSHSLSLEPSPNCEKKTWQRFQSVISFPRLLIIVNKFTLENFFIFAWAWNNYHFNSKHLTTVNKQQSCLPPPGSTPMRTRCRVWSPPALIPLRTRRTASLHHTRRRRRRLHTTALIWSRHSLPERGRVC